MNEVRYPKSHLGCTFLLVFQVSLASSSKLSSKIWTPSFPLRFYPIICFSKEPLSIYSDLLHLKYIKLYEDKGKQGMFMLGTLLFVFGTAMHSDTHL